MSFLRILVFIMTMQTAWMVKAGCLGTCKTGRIFSLHRSYTWYKLHLPSEYIHNTSQAVLIHYYSSKPGNIHVKIMQNTTVRGRHQSLFQSTIEMRFGHISIPLHVFNGFKPNSGSFIGLPKRVQVLTIELIQTGSENTHVSPLLFGLDIFRKHEFVQKTMRRRTCISSSKFFLHIDRHSLFKDAMIEIMNLPNKVLYGQMSVKLFNETAYSGVKMAWRFFNLISRELMEANNEMFDPFDESGNALVIRPSVSNIYKFEFLGRLMALALIQNRVIELSLAKPIWKLILGKEVNLTDLKKVDSQIYMSLLAILDHNNVEKLGLSMPANGNDPFADNPSIRTVPITQDNKVRYVEWVWQWLLETRINGQIQAIRAGLFGLIPKNMIMIFDEHELELAVTGLPTIDVSVWKLSTRYIFCSEKDTVVQWFWQAMENWTADMRSSVLVFATGSSRMPADWTLGKADAKSPFVIKQTWRNARYLPTGYSSLHMIALPSYKSYSELESKLRVAVTDGAGLSI